MAKAKKPSKKRPAKKAGAKRPAAKIELRAFFRKLWSKPAMLEQFSASPQGRDQVLDKFNLSARHREMLVRGCMREIIPELAGVKAMADNNTVVNCGYQADCGHAECAAFMAAVKPR